MFAKVIVVHCIEETGILDKEETDIFGNMREKDGGVSLLHVVGRPWPRCLVLVVTTRMVRVVSGWGHPFINVRGEGE